MKTIPSQSERVLVVDDEPNSLAAMVETLRAVGFDVLLAGNGSAAWEQFQQQQVDIVVTDIRMPEGDGLTLTRHIKEMRPSCPVIIVTGLGDAATAIAALKAGASDYLLKPFEAKDLCASVDRACLLIQNRLVEQSILPAVEQAEIRLIVTNRPEQVTGIINVLLHTFESCLPDVELFHLRVVLQELLVNAIEHGNLNIGADEKMEMLFNDQYDQFLNERKTSPAYAQRQVKVVVRHQAKEGRAHFSICDDGEGFPWQKMLKRDQSELPALAGSGRGLFLVKTLMPNLAYNEKGNEVTFTLHYHHPSR